MPIMETNELEGALLNWAVAKAEGIPDLECWHTGAVTTRQPNGVTVTHRYATDWLQAGVIIERERISVEHRGDAGGWRASIWMESKADFLVVGNRGPYCQTALIAAMRAFVASRLGGKIHIPGDILLILAGA